MDKSKLLTVPSTPKQSFHCEPADLRSLKTNERYDSKRGRYEQADDDREAQYDYEPGQGPGWNLPEFDGDISELAAAPALTPYTSGTLKRLTRATALGAKSSSPWHHDCSGRAIRNTDSLHPAASQRHDTVYSMHHGDNSPIMGTNEIQYKPVNRAARRYPATTTKPVIASKRRSEQYTLEQCTGGVCQTTWKPQRKEA